MYVLNEPIDSEILFLQLSPNELHVTESFIASNNFII